MKPFSTLTMLAALAADGFAAAPITFEENRGQASPGVLFLSHVSGHRIFLTRDRLVIASREGRSVRIGLLHAKSGTPVAVGRLSATSYYFVGSDPAAWHTGIANYKQVRYPHVYPGIDMVWHARGGQMESDFMLAPGTDARRIRIDIDGAEPKLGPEQDLIAGDLRLHEPRAFQDGREVLCRYTLRGHTVSLVLGRYNHARPLTIDPVLSFSTFLGTESAASAVAVDGAGNIYLGGTTTSASFPVTGGAFQQNYASGLCGAPPGGACPDVFISKLSADGSTLLFSTFLGGSGWNTLAGMAVDQSGNVYLTGTPSGSDFPKLTPLPGNTLIRGSYVAKLSADGSALLYATSLPCTTSAVAVDSAGAVYLTGATGGSFGGPLPLLNALQNTMAKPVVFKTSDSGVTWQGLGAGFTDVGLVSTITVDPTNSQTIYFGFDDALYKSTDGGTTWTAIQNGLPLQGPSVPGLGLSPTLVVVDPLHPQTLYLGTSYGVYKSTDGGADWALSGNGASTFIRSLAIDPLSTTTLYAVASWYYTGFGMLVPSALYKSLDGGATWNTTGLVAPPSNPNFVNSITSIVVDPKTPATLYAGTTVGVYKSLDGSSSWALMTNGFSQSTEVEALAIDPVNPQNLYAATTVNFAPYYTTAGGAHWTQGQWPGLPPSPNDQGTYANCLLVDPANDSTVWAGTDYGILVSRDYGATWGSPTTGLPENGIEGLAADSTGTIYAIVNNADLPAAFAMKLDPTGTKLVYSTYLGGSGSDLGYGIAIDSAGRAYITGRTDSFDFPIQNALQPRFAGLTDAFVTVLNPTGEQLEWSTFFGGSGDDSASAIALDAAGNIHITGTTHSPDFPLQKPTQAHLGGTNGDGNAFAAVLKGNGSAAILSTYLGGSSYDSANAVATDPAGDTYIAGQTSSVDFPTLNAIQSTLAGTANGFVAAWNGQTGALEYSTFLGGSGTDSVSAVAADAAGDAYVAGSTSSADFPQKYAFQSSFGNCYYNPEGGCAGVDAFLAVISPQGTGPHIAVSSATNAASYTATIAPGEVVGIFGTFLAITTAVADSLPLPQRLSDLEMSVNGVPAPLYYVSPTQVNAQIPFETATGPAQIEVSSSAGTAMIPVQVLAAAPGIFTLSASGSGAGAIEHGVTGQLVTAASPAGPGEILSIYCTGLGAVSPSAADGWVPPIPPPQTVAAVQVYIASALAQVNYAGLAPGFAGLYQVNAQVPAGTPSGNQNLQIRMAGASSNTVLVAIQ